MPTPEQCAVTDTKITGIDREIIAMRLRQDRLDERLDSLTSSVNDLKTMVAQVRAFVAALAVLSILPDSILDILK
jgi:hypothetical protein